MIEKLTAEQESKISEYRDRYFELAISTKRADREKAETAVRSLFELVGIEMKLIEWVSSPDEAGKRYSSLVETLWVSLRVSLSGSILDSVRDSLMETLMDSLWASLINSLSGTLSNSLLESLMDSLRDSLRESLWCSLSDSLSDTLRDSLMDLPFDTGLVCYYTYCRDVLGVEYSEKSSRMLDAYNELLGSCFGLWVIPDGTVILCERPVSVEVKDGRLIDIQWVA